MLKLFIRLKKEESGQALILVALMMVVLLGIGSLVIDFGYMSMQKSQLQTAADSAALAGARSIYEKTTNEIKNIANATATANLEGPITVLTTPIKTEGTVTVEVSQVAPKFLSGILTDSTTTIKASASAKYIKPWEGETLPFVNMHEEYTIGEDIVLWEKEDSGIFSRIWKDENLDGDKKSAYYRVSYNNGIQTDNGVTAYIKEELLAIPTGTTLYFFSLKQSIIDTYTLDKDVKDDKKDSPSKGSFGDPYGYLNENKPNVLPQHLVLLKVKLVHNEFKNLVFEVEKIYESDFFLNNPIDDESRVYLFK